MHRLRRGQGSLHEPAICRHIVFSFLFFHFLFQGYNIAYILSSIPCKLSIVLYLGRAVKCRRDIQECSMQADSKDF